VLPLGLPILTSLALRRGGVLVPVVTLACFALAWTAARGQARRIQQQIDDLERVPAAGAD
jgi:hypothetical protein